MVQKKAKKLEKKASFFRVLRKYPSHSIAQDYTLQHYGMHP